MRRLKVLLLIDYVGVSGGAERFTVGLATHLPRDRFEVWICSSRAAEPEALSLLEQAGVHHVSLGRRGKLDVHRLGGLARLLRREPFDILHAQKFGSNLWGSLIASACRTPVIIAQEHTWSYEGQPARRWLDGHVIGRLATRFVAISAQDADRMVTVEHVPAAKVTLIPSAYVPRPSSDTDIRAELGITTSTPLLAVVAVLRPQKALSVLLDALPRVLEAAPEAHLVIAGEGECHAALTEQSERLGLAEHVHFVGRRTDVEDVLAAADVAVISSDYEGTPLVAYECFANATPLVATAVGGLVDMIDDGVTGRLVPPRDPFALAEAIIGLVNNPEQRRRIAAAAAQSPALVRIDAVAQRFGELYDTLAAENGVTAPRGRSAPPGPSRDSVTG